MAHCVRWSEHRLEIGSVLNSKEDGERAGNCCRRMSKLEGDVYPGVEKRVV